MQLDGIDVSHRLPGLYLMPFLDVEAHNLARTSRGNGHFRSLEHARRVVIAASSLTRSEQCHQTNGYIIRTYRFHHLLFLFVISYIFQIIDSLQQFHFVQDFVLNSGLLGVDIPCQVCSR